MPCGYICFPLSLRMVDALLAARGIMVSHETVRQFNTWSTPARNLRPSAGENAMSDPLRPYQPLTAENAVLVLVDHQVGLMTGVRDYSTGELKHNVVALAKAAKALQLPIIVTTTARDSM
jgi:hypothetical protein